MRPHLRTLAHSQDLQNILGRTRTFAPEAPRQWGSMTAGGAVCHLAACFEMALGEKLCAPRTGLFERTVLKFGALRLPLPWPHGVNTLPELIEGRPGILPGEFTQDRSRLIEAIHRFVAASQFAPVHPNFGPMSRWDWMRWGYLHTDHHLRQFGQ